MLIGYPSDIIYPNHFTVEAFQPEKLKAIRYTFQVNY